MAMIYVKTKPGRAAFFEGRAIPHDVFYPVPDTAYIRRLATHWEDIEVQDKQPASKPARPATQPVVPTATPQAASAPTAPPNTAKEIK